MPTNTINAVLVERYTATELATLLVENVEVYSAAEVITILQRNTISRKLFNGLSCTQLAELSHPSNKTETLIMARRLTERLFTFWLTENVTNRIRATRSGVIGGDDSPSK